MPGESFILDCNCDSLPGTTAPDTTQYVVSLNNLVGQVTLAGTGATAISSTGNTITIGLTADAGLGSVTSVGLTSSNSNLTVAGSPITTNGSITLNLAGNLSSISAAVMAADTMLYATGAATFTTTTLTSFGRSLIDDATAAAARTTLGAVIGTDVQAWNADLDAFVTNASWSGSALTLAGALTVTGATTLSSSLDVATTATIGGTLDVTSVLTAGLFSGDGSGLGSLNASGITSGTLLATRGGTGIVSYAVGDLLYALTTTSLAKLADVSAGSYLRSGGVSTAPLWSTLKLPNASTAGDVLISDSANNITTLADVATGSVLRSGGVGVVPSYGKVTSSHVDSTIPTMAAGTNSNITAMSGLSSVTSDVDFTGIVGIIGTLTDSLAGAGTSGQVLTSTGSAILWSNDPNLNSVTINTRLSCEATTTAGGTTGDQTINKLAGSVNFAAGASSLVVTNSLVASTDYIFCTVLTNDTTALIKNVVASSGAFTIRLNAAATAETKVAFLVIRPS